MNARAEIPPAASAAAGPAGRLLTLPMPLRRRLADGTLVPLAEGVAGLFFDTGPSEPGETRGRLTARIDDAMLTPPFISTRLALRTGGQRHLLLAGRSAAALLGQHVQLDLGGQPAAAIHPGWLQSPLGDAAALIEGLSDEGRRRLLTLFLTTGPSLFGAAAGAAFGGAARHLLDLLGVQPVLPASLCALGAGGIVSYRLPGPVDPERLGEIVMLDAGRSQRLTGCRPVVEIRDRTCLLHLHLPRLLPAAAALVGLGPTPVQLRLPAAETRLRPLLPWLERRDAATRAWVHDLIEAAAPTDPAAGALVRELRHGASAAPAVEVLHLSATPRGVLVALSLNDDEDLVREIRLERGGASAVLGPPQRGYVPLPRRSAIDDRFRLRMVFHSGRRLTVAEGPLAPFRADGLPAGFRTGDAPALAAARLDRERPDRARLLRGRRVESFGTPPETPVLRLIVPLGGSADVLRARAALVATERAGRRVEVICHGQTAMAEALADIVAETATIFGVAHRILSLPRAAEPLDGLRAALELAADAPALLLGANVLPDGPGWLAPWLRQLGAPWAALGGTLLDHHGAVLHAGGALTAIGEGPARRVAPHIGLPAADLPRGRTVAGSLMTAECVGLTAAAVSRLAATDDACPDPEAALALAVRGLAADGAATGTALRSRFVRFDSNARPAMEEAVQAHALGLLLKRSFSVAGQEGQS